MLRDADLMGVVMVDGGLMASSMPLELASAGE